jgi:hypothetical protein
MFQVVRRFFKHENKLQRSYEFQQEPLILESLQKKLELLFKKLQPMFRNKQERWGKNSMNGAYENFGSDSLR